MANSSLSAQLRWAVVSRQAPQCGHRDGSFDDPSFWQNREALRGIGPLDDIDVDPSEDAAKGGLKNRPLIATVGIELEQEWIHAEQSGHH